MRHSHSHACVRQHMSIARTCMNAHMVPHVHTRSHAIFPPAHAQRRGAPILDIRRSKTGNPHRTHMSIARTLHARTHGRAHSHARTHEIIHVHGDTHTARTRNIRNRKCATPGSIRILGIRRAKTDNPHGTLPPCLTFLIYHRRLHMFSRVVGTGALVCIATPPLGSPATHWPTMHLRHATHKGWRNARVRDSAPQCAPRLHMLS